MVQAPAPATCWAGRALPRLCFPGSPPCPPPARRSHCPCPGRFCGSRLPPTLTSTRHVMTVLFVADDGVADNGFFATYQAWNATERRSRVLGGWGHPLPGHGGLGQLGLLSPLLCHLRPRCLPAPGCQAAWWHG